MGALRARGSAAASTCRQGPASSSRRHRASVPWPGEAGASAAWPQLVAVLVPDAGEEPGPHRLPGAHGVQEAGDEAHVADLQHRVPLRQGQAPQGQGHHLGGGRPVHGADALQAHLPDLPEGAALPAGAVDVLRVVEAAARPRLHRGVLGDGEGHVRLQGQQPPVQVREGDDLLTGQEAAVLLVEAVLLEPAHVVVAEARPLVQQPAAAAPPAPGAAESSDPIPWGTLLPAGGARIDFRVYFTLFY